MTESSPIRLQGTWKEVLRPEFDKDYMVQLKSFLKTEYGSKKRIFPLGNEYFAALDLTPFEKVRVVILGQDPYHGEGQAHGLCFSVRPGVRMPPSLQNIYKEMKDDLGITQPQHGNLESWARQGVLLLNSVLTVEKGRPGSHQNRGWERFTDRIIHLLNDREEALVFILWGSYAQKKGAFIDRKKHLVLSAPHPSPFSAHSGFFGSRPFSKANAFLKAHDQPEIDWQLPPITHH